MKNNYYKILSLDGGGIRGLLTIEIMKRIEDFLGYKWYERSDFYAGTSTGGLIALTLADERDLDAAEKLYVQYGPKIFNKFTWRYIASFFRTFHAGYDNRILAERLKDIFKEKTIDKFRKKILITAFDLVKKVEGEKKWKPKIFHNFPGKGQDKVEASKLGLYTSAAPTYLPSVHGYVDGGVCANNPAMCAIAQVLNEKKNLKKNINDIVMISIGTGEPLTPIKKKKISWGILGWSKKLINMLFDGPVGVVDYQCRQILENRYLRIQIDIESNMGLDSADKIKKMKKLVASIKDEKIKEWGEWINKHWK